MKVACRTLWALCLIWLLGAHPGPCAWVAADTSPPRSAPAPHAAERLGAQAAEEKLVSKIYDVGDLLRIPVDRPLDPRLVSPTQLGRERPQGDHLLEGKQPPQPQRGDTLTAANIVDIVESQVTPESWRAAGDQTSARLVENMLLVRQTPGVQRQLEVFLGELRKNREASRSVIVHADWLLLGPDDLGRIIKPDPAGAPAREVDSSAVVKLGTKVILAHGDISCAGGQTVHLVSGRVRTVVQGLENSTGDGTAAYQPEVDELLSGAALQVTPHIQGTSALVDLLAYAGGWDEPGKPYHIEQHVSGSKVTTQPSDPSISGHADSDATIDRLDAPGQELATTARLPLGKTVLIGGMTAEPKLKAGREAATTQSQDHADPRGERQLYLIMRVDAE